MNYKRILITGSAGFIGFHLAKSLLKDKIEIYGIDDINNYYSIKLKNTRLNKLKKFKNFKFKNVNICSFNELEKVFIKFKPNIVVNMAAQAGVRYSIKNPFSYIQNNIVGFTNVIELCKRYKVKGLIYASSSSVYGGNNKIPFNENDVVSDPLSIYAASKISNELIARSYSNLFGIKTTGLRFFTVYGPWGRPDMAYYIFADKISSNQKISIFNHGKMKRDFTYIDDIIIGVRLSIEKNYDCEIFNLGNNKTVELMDLVYHIEKYLAKKANVEYLPMQDGDVEETYADISKSNQKLGFIPKINIDVGLEKFIDWYKQYES